MVHVNVNVSCMGLGRLIIILLYLCLISGEVVDYSEKFQLLEMKNAILDPHNMLSSWKSTSLNHCSWFGVTCNSRGRVSELIIPGGNFAHSGSCLSDKYRNLAWHDSGIDRDCSSLKKGRFLGGKLSNVIGKLSELQVLSLPFNQIRGGLPSGIWGLKNLKVIDIEGNTITANLSMINFTNLKNLQVLNLGFNRLFGGIPDSLSECEALTFFNLAGNQIGGPVPDFLGNFVKLKLINLSLNRFMGSLQDGFWSDCDGLEHVDFSGNLLNDKIPKSFGNCSALRTLLLSSNRFSGVLPFELGNLQMLQVLDASKNRISGRIPNSLLNLRNLKLLLLNNNRLSGEIPSGIQNLKTHARFNFSFNNLSELVSVDHNSINCKSLTGNPLLHRCHFLRLSSVPPQEPWAVSIESQNATNSSDSNGGKKGKNSFGLVLIIVPSAIVVVLLALLVTYLYMRKQKPTSEVAPGTSPRPPPSPPPPRHTGQLLPLVVFKEIGVQLTLDSVVQATGNFTARNCIGSGGFGSTYRAEISPGITVAVKRLTVEMCQGVPQFNAEIRSLGRIRHPNLITLIGYYASQSEMFLIYNYLAGGNLEKFILERARRGIGLKILHKIALDVANGLYFLHDQCKPRILHRDVKPSNILLDEEFNAYLSDFGLARLLDDFETHVTTGVAGTFGYVAPEYALTCRASEKADVYSYGVMLLELISDKRALDSSFSNQENGYTIVSWATMLRREGRPEEVFTAGLWEAGPEDVLLELLHLGLVCTGESVGGRPSMSQVVGKLEQIQPAINC